MTSDGSDSDRAGRNVIDGELKMLPATFRASNGEKVFGVIIRRGETYVGMIRGDDPDAMRRFESLASIHEHSHRHKKNSESAPLPVASGPEDRP